MASKKLQKQIERELKRITESIPEHLLKTLMKKEIIAPTAKGLFGKALEDPTITPEQRERFELILASGVLDREVEVVDFDVEKAIDAYYTAEIALSVKAGRLPAEAPQWDKLQAKGKKYARKQQRRLKALFGADENPEAGAPGIDSGSAEADSARGPDGGSLQVDGLQGGGQAEEGGIGA